MGPLVLLLLVAGLAVPARDVGAAHAPPLTTRRGVVASDHAAASEVGARVLAAGGNAVDAAAATALALGVVNPVSSGIGGGGFAVVWSQQERKVFIYDFRETAPAALGPEDFRVDGKIDGVRSRVGGLAVGVPGEIAGLHRMVTERGAWSWSKVVGPAARLARDGFEAGWFFVRAMGVVGPRWPKDAAFDRARAMGVLRGAPVQRGDRITRPELARTLQAIAARGPAAFYKGPIAADIVATVTRAGGVLTAADLAGYQVVMREPLWGEWRGMRLATMPLPSSGGVVLLEMLGILDRTGIDLAKLGPSSSAALHVIAEIQKHGFADRARFLGDDDIARELAKRILAPERLATLARRVSLDKVQPHDQYGGAGLGPDALKPGKAPAAPGKAPAAPGTKLGGTSHVCVVDKDGNAVALTSTVNGYLGSGLVTAGGITLNNEIDDFALEPGGTNLFGLTQSALNLVAPGKRPLSSMAPTLVFDGDKVVGCAGGSGGPTILSSTLQVLLGTFVFGLDAAEAVGAPRVHHQWEPDRLVVNPDLPRDVVEGLERRGHKVHVSESITAAQVIRVLPDGTREAASDPRKGGAPAAQDRGR
jgi:gamma-glutamyltranspeptidase/glutathione hydrolase